MCYDEGVDFFLQTEDGIRGAREARELGDVYNRLPLTAVLTKQIPSVLNPLFTVQLLPQPFSLNRYPHFLIHCSLFSSSPSRSPKQVPPFSYSLPTFPPPPPPSLPNRYPHFFFKNQTVSRYPRRRPQNGSPLSSSPKPPSTPNHTTHQKQ